MSSIFSLFSGTAYMLDSRDPNVPLAERLTSGRLAIIKFNSLRVDVALFTYEAGNFSDGVLGEWDSFAFSGKSDGSPQQVAQQFSASAPWLTKWFAANEVADSVVVFYSGVAPMLSIPVGLELADSHLEYESNYESRVETIEEFIRGANERPQNSMEVGYSFVGQSGITIALTYSRVLEEAASSVVERAGGVVVKSVEMVTALAEYAFRSHSGLSKLAILTEELVLGIDVVRGELVPFRRQLGASAPIGIFAKRGFLNGIVESGCACVSSLDAETYQAEMGVLSPAGVVAPKEDAIVTALREEPLLGLVYDLRGEGGEFLRPISPKFKPLAWLALCACVLALGVAAWGFAMAQTVESTKPIWDKMDAIFEASLVSVSSTSGVDAVIQQADELGAWLNANLNVQHFAYAIFQVLREYGGDVTLREFSISEREVHDEFGFSLTIDASRSDLPMMIAQAIDVRVEELGFSSVSVGGSTYGVNSEGSIVFSDNYVIPSTQTKPNLAK